nr:DUF6616 family protein [Bradyrhizobium tropiciagri]
MTEKWEALDEQSRHLRFEEMRRRVEPLLAGGSVKCFGWGLNMEDIDRPVAAQQKFFCIWTAESKDGVMAFAKAEREIGWYEFAAQVNYIGELMPLDAMSTYLETH